MQPYYHPNRSPQLPLVHAPVVQLVPSGKGGLGAQVPVAGSQAPWVWHSLAGGQVTPTQRSTVCEGEQGKLSFNQGCKRISSFLQCVPSCFQ